MSATPPTPQAISAPTTFPISIVVFCDRCGVEVEHDYLVHDLMTREQRLAVAREHLARNEGWSCTAAGDFCPDHKPEPVHPVPEEQQ
jgi:hypothetical protein